MVLFQSMIYRYSGRSHHVQADFAEPRFLRERVMRKIHVCLDTGVGVNTIDGIRLKHGAFETVDSQPCPRNANVLPETAVGVDETPKAVNNYVYLYNEDMYIYIYI